MKKLNPFLWFDSEAEQAAKFCVGIFKNSKIGKIARYPKEAAEKIGRPPGSVMTVEFTLDRGDFIALNPESVRGSSSSLKRSRSRSTARPRMRSIISGRNFPPMADRSRKLSGLAQRQIRSLVAGQPRLSRRYVGRSRCREGESRHEGDDGNGQDRHRRLRKGRERMKEDEQRSTSNSKRIETRSLPTLTQCFPRNFAFYVAHPIRFIREEAPNVE